MESPLLVLVERFKFSKKEGSFSLGGFGSIFVLKI